MGNYSFSTGVFTTSKSGAIVHHELDDWDKKAICFKITSQTFYERDIDDLIEFLTDAKKFLKNRVD